MDSLPFQYQKRDYWEFYCPVCKVLRRTFYWPSPRPRHYAQLIFASIVLTMALWAWIGLKGAFFFFPMWAVFEFFYRARARQSMICTHCGFDPYLYKFDVKLARQKVEKFFADREHAREQFKKQVAELQKPPTEPDKNKS